MRFERGSACESKTEVDYLFASEKGGRFVARGSSEFPGRAPDTKLKTVREDTGKSLTELNSSREEVIRLTILQSSL